jgi:hypothetical protein
MRITPATPIVVDRDSGSFHTRAQKPRNELVADGLTDRAWPMPVWGQFPAVSYSRSALDDIRLKLHLAALDGFTEAAEHDPDCPLVTS